MAESRQDAPAAVEKPRPVPAPRREGRTHERSLALFAAGIAAFTPPLLMVFDRPGTAFGLPVLYLYLFAVWGLLIALAGRVAVRWRRRPPPEES